MAVVAMTGRERLALIAAFAAVYLVWGSTFLAIRWAVETIPPLLMIGVRCLLSGAVLYAWARLRGGPRPSAADWRAALLAGVLLFVTGQAVLAWAEMRIESGPAALLIATEPLFIAMLAWWGGRWTGTASSAPGAGMIVALLIGFAGVGVMVLPGANGGLDPLGAAAALVASVSWSAGMFRAGARPGLGPAQAAGMQLLMAGVVLLAITAATGEFMGIPAGGPSARSLLSLLYLTVFGSIITFGAYVWLLGRVGPSRLSTHAYVNPVVAVALGALLGGEAITPSLVVASAMILASVVALLRRHPAPTRPDRRPRGPRGPHSRWPRRAANPHTPRAPRTGTPPVPQSP